MSEEIRRFLITIEGVDIHVVASKNTARSMSEKPDVTVVELGDPPELPPGALDLLLRDRGVIVLGKAVDPSDIQPVQPLVSPPPTSNSVKEMLSRLETKANRARRRRKRSQRKDLWKKQ